MQSSFTVCLVNTYDMLRNLLRLGYMIYLHVHQESIKAIVAQLNLCCMGLCLSKRLLYNSSSFIFELHQHGIAEMSKLSRLLLQNSVPVK